MFCFKLRDGPYGGSRHYIFLQFCSLRRVSKSNIGRLVETRQERKAEPYENVSSWRNFVWYIVVAMYKKNCVWMDFVLEQRQPYFLLRLVGVKLAWRNGKQFSPGPVFSAKKQRQGVVFCCGGGVTSPGPSVPSGLLVRGRWWNAYPDGASREQLGQLLGQQQLQLPAWW